MPKKLSCRFCGTLDEIVKYGKTSNGSQRYRCKACQATFINNESLTRHLQISDILLRKFIGLMIDDVALDVIARNLKINIKTAHYYRFLIFNVLRDYQESVRLTGTILIDETFIRIREKLYKIYRPDGQDIRGLSFNQLCVITLINLQGLCMAKVSSRAMALPEHYIKLFTNNIEKVKLFIHDGNTKQYQFMNQFDCEKVNARKDTTGNYDSLLIDALHSNIKRYLFKHAGYRLKYVQHYLNFFVYRHNQLTLAKPSNTKQSINVKNKMIDELFKKMKQSKKTIKYSNYLKDLGITDILMKR